MYLYNVDKKPAKRSNPVLYVLLQKLCFTQHNRNYLKCKMLVEEIIVLRL